MGNGFRVHNWIHHQSESVALDSFHAPSEIAMGNHHYAGLDTVAVSS